MMQPMMQPGMPMQQPMMQPGMPVQQPQQTQVVTTTTTQDMGADGKPGTVFSRNGACFIISIVLTIIFAASANAMNSAMNNSIKVAANRDEVYAAIGMKQLCDNPMKIADTISKTHKGKCVDFKAKWHIRNNVEVRTSAGFSDNVIDAKCTETHVMTEMYVKYETCRKVIIDDNHGARAELEEEEEKLTKLERATSNCYSGDRDCECKWHQGWMTDVQGLDQPYDFKFPTHNGGGLKTFTGAADNAVLKQTDGATSDRRPQTRSHPTTRHRTSDIGNTGKTEI